MCSVLYYLAYLAEENINLPEGEAPTYTVAPGCLGSRPNNGCTLKEFLLYNWKALPSSGDVDAPTGFSAFQKLSADITTETTDQLISKINAARTNVININTNKYFSITGNTDPAKLMPGHGDYYDILGDMGGPINTMINSIGDGTATFLQTRIQNLAKDAATAVVGLRWGDMERYRITALTKNLGFRPSTSAWNVGYQNRVTNILNIPQTIADHEAPNTVNELIVAVDDYATKGDSQIGHFKAIFFRSAGGLRSWMRNSHERCALDALVELANNGVHHRRERLGAGCM